MSRLAIYGVNKDGDVERVCEMGNSWRGAVLVWSDLGKKYLGDSSNWEASWTLKNDARLSDAEWTVMLMTFDDVIIPAEHMEYAAKACDTACLGHYGPEMATTIRKMVADGFVGLCFNQTTVNSNPWSTYDSETDESTPYNVRTGTKHWFFDPSTRGQP